MTYATACADISMRQKSAARHHQSQAENPQGILMREKQQSRAASNEQQIQLEKLDSLSCRYRAENSRVWRKRSDARD